MYTPSLKEFLKLSQKGNLIPIYTEIDADLDTPVSTFLKIRKVEYSFLLESIEGQEKIAHYSFLGSNPSLVFQSKGKFIQISYPHKKSTKRFITKTSPIDEIEKIMRNFKGVSVKGLPRFYGGLVGYMGYDMVRFIEELPDKNKDDLNLPDAVFILTDTILIFDHVNHTIKIINNIVLPKLNGRLSKAKLIRIYNNAIKKIESIQRDFKKAIVDKKTSGRSLKEKVTSNFNKSEFKNIVKAAKEYIRQGDIIQVVLSQRFKIKIKRGPFEIYRKLRSLNPSPYMYFLKFKDLAVIGASPEMLVRCEGGFIQTRPIAGTRPRGNSEREDEKLKKELLRDKKEKAEHLMLVDLGRNDLGRVCKTGTVGINEFMNVEKYSHVMHLVSEVSGRLDNRRFNVYDVLSSTFPAGTVTGSPKIRAMEIIDELENVRRGPYAGCVGYFSFSHNMDTCITIRTIIIRRGSAYIQAGAGIVADSVPENEYLESVNKAKAMIEAITK